MVCPAVRIPRLISLFLSPTALPNTFMGMSAVIPNLKCLRYLYWKVPKDICKMHLLVCLWEQPGMPNWRRLGNLPWVSSQNSIGWRPEWNKRDKKREPASAGTSLLSAHHEISSLPFHGLLLAWSWASICAQSQTVSSHESQLSTHKSKWITPSSKLFLSMRMWSTKPHRTKMVPDRYSHCCSQIWL